MAYKIGDKVRFVANENGYSKGDIHTIDRLGDDSDVMFFADGNGNGALNSWVEPVVEAEPVKPIKKVNIKITDPNQIVGQDLVADQLKVAIDNDLHVLLVDCSGSMQRHDRYVKAGEVAAFLTSNFTGLNINLAVVSFNHYVSIVKNFDEVVEPQKIAQHISDATNGYGNGCNHDFSAMQFAYNLFKGRKGQNLLLMMSDGDPATCGYQYEIDQDPTEYKKQLKEFRKDKQLRLLRDGKYTVGEDSGWAESEGCIFYCNKKEYIVPLNHIDGVSHQDKKHFHHLVKAQRNIESVGIGIETDSWQVPDNIVVNDLEELKPQILKIISKKIRRA